MQSRTSYYEKRIFTKETRACKVGQIIMKIGYLQKSHVRVYLT